MFLAASMDLTAPTKMTVGTDSAIEVAALTYKVSAGSMTKNSPSKSTEPENLTASGVNGEVFLC